MIYIANMEENKDYGMDELCEMLRQFNNDPFMIVLKERDKTQSIMEIMGVNRLENSHSAFFAWLFNSNSDHKLGVTPTNKFMMLLEKHHKRHSDISYGDNDIPHSTFYDFVTGNDAVLKSESKTEFVGEEKGNRPDILIEIQSFQGKRIRIIFENKITTRETNEQTKRYYKEYSAKKDDWLNIYVYNTHTNCKSPIDKHYIHLHYQDIVDYVIEPLLAIPTLTERTKIILEDYLLALEKAAKVKNSKDKIVMAMGKDQKELLTKFWENNVELIVMAAKALGKDDVVKAIKSTYIVEFNGDEYYTLGNAVKAIIEYLCDNNVFKSISELQDFLKKCKHSRPLILASDYNIGIKDEGRFHDEQQLLGNAVRINKGWNGKEGDNFDQFIDICKEKCTENDIPFYFAKNFSK